VTKLGVVFRPQFAPERLRSVVRVADEVGLDELWLWEDCFFESGLATAAAALGWSERVRVGVGLMPVPLRNVALSAMEMATVERLFPGRSTLAFGHGVQQWMGQVGARAESPVTLLREYLVALKRLLAGERVTTTGRYVNLDEVQLYWPPEVAPPVFAGASGPKSLALCGEVADGIVLTSSAGVDGVARMRELAPELPITVYSRAAIGADARERLDAEDIDDAVGYAGDEIPGMVEQLAAAGATTVVLEPTGDDPDLEGLVRFAAGLKPAS
jgi:alkanesulfonate monooxygenase SsuD/methylene tetrahydromethanopterin reductase-like flavin-dependent oxidoreductase (luciferase family)